MPRPIARVLALLELLQSGGIRTAAELADRLGVDERTVRHYIGHLIDLDIPVESVRGRHGGYRLAPGHRMPPLMLNDDEALAVALGLVAGERAGLTPSTSTGTGTGAGTSTGAGASTNTGTGTASETAAAKIRRVLPGRLRLRLDAVLGSLAFTAPPRTPAAAPATEVLLPIADAVNHHRPVTIRYTSADGRHSERTLHPHGLVVHSGKWYTTAADLTSGQDRTFRLDRITDVRTLPGSFEPPPAADPAERVLTALATAPYRYEVSLRVQATAEHIHTRLPPSVAVVHELPSPGGADAQTERWSRVGLRVDRLDWLPAVLASLDRPFVIDRPDELRGLVEALAERLTASARRTPPQD
ncbi:WYL domain-containing protein [Streptomyces armeniacus]|uniref:WYL domain-containing protein n=1 Tax=Streptomyces armeniacus TaxID=83291 RepID=A0A345XVY3_9ACTN|nr:WYL domain-containing protein [Streptomyces armeniacus]AXK35799.1 WYL domain-containing protein [Streptomyces armeniacus]